MDPRPDVLRAQIEGTRAALDHDLDELETRIAVTKEHVKERVKVNAQWWGGVSAVVAGVIGMFVFWPRQVERRHVARPFGAAG